MRESLGDDFGTIRKTVLDDIDFSVGTALVTIALKHRLRGRH